MHSLGENASDTEFDVIKIPISKTKSGTIDLCKINHIDAHNQAFFKVYSDSINVSLKW